MTNNRSWNLKTQFKFTLDVPKLDLQIKYLKPLLLKLDSKIKINYSDFRKIDWYFASDVAISRYLKSKTYKTVN